MLRNFIAGGLFAAALVGGVGVGSAAHGDAPQLRMGSNTRDFGEVFAGEELETFFTIRNEGTAPLELAQKQTTALTTPVNHDLRAVLRTVAARNYASHFVVAPAARLHPAPS